jgi:hypothetical protein
MHRCYPNLDKRARFRYTWFANAMMETSTQAEGAASLEQVQARHSKPAENPSGAAQPKQNQKSQTWQMFGVFNQRVDCDGAVFR